MGRYLVLWEVEKAHMHVDSKERGEGWALLMAMTKQDMEKGVIKEWGAIVGENRGFNLVEGSEVEVANMVQQYVPYINVEVLPIATFDQIEEVVKTLTG